MSAPDFELPATDGSTHALSGSGAAATVVYWTCNHCPYALAWEERMHAVARDYGDRGVRDPGDQLERLREPSRRLARGDGGAGRG